MRAPYKDSSWRLSVTTLAYLLYAARWFPVNAYGINRFTATINITVPAHMVVIGSGKETASSSPARKGRGRRIADQNLHLCLGASPVFPERSLPVSSRSSKATKPGWICTFSSSRTTRPWEPQYTETAVKEFIYYVTLYGPLHRLHHPEGGRNSG